MIPRAQTFLPLLLALLWAACSPSSPAAPPAFYPREYATIPVNGTDTTENPVALQYAFDLGTKAASHVFECGDHISFLDDIECLETPHTDWADPYAGGPLRVLAFAGHRGYVRSVIELRHRSSLDFTFAMRPMMYHYKGYRYPSILRHFRERYRRLLEREWDVILLPSHDTLNLLDDETLPRIAEKIRNGTPALCVLNSTDWNRDMYDETRALYEAISPLQFVEGNVSDGIVAAAKGTRSPLAQHMAWTLWPRTATLQKTALREGADALVECDGVPIAATAMYGAGRVVAVVPPAIPSGENVRSFYDTGDEPVSDDVYELGYSLVLKALLWAAREEPRGVLRFAADQTVSAGTTPDLTVELEAAADAEGAPVGLAFRLKDPWGAILAEGVQDVELAQGRASVILTLPPLAINGRHRVDLWVRQDDAVVTWGHAALTVVDGAAVSVACVQAPAQPGDEAVYRITTGGLNGELSVTAVDGLDRVFALQRLAVADGATVRIDTSRSLHPYNRLTFELLDSDGNPAARRIEELFIPRIGLDALKGEYSIITYGRPSTPPHLMSYLGDLYREAGFNTVYYHWHSRHRVWETACMGLPGITGTMPPFLKQANFEEVLRHCPNKPEIRAEWDAKITEALEDIRDYGSLARIIDDECYLAFAGYRDGAFRGAQACQCEHCLALFRARMEEAYGDIDALNTTWGTDFAGFEDVRVIEEDEISVLDNPSGWLEFRQFMNEVFADQYYGRMGRQHAALGPSFHVGPGAPNYTTGEGGPTYKGGDYRELQRSLTFMLAYGGPESEVFDDLFVGQPGAQKYDPPIWWKEWGPWQALLRGADGLWFYNGKQIAGFEVSWRKHAEWIEQGVHDIVRGAGVLVRDAEPLNKQVCIFYSPENLAMGWLFGKRRDAWRGFQLAGGRARSTGTLDRLLSDYFCMQAATVTSDDIAAGVLAECKLLFLPAAFNMDDATVAIIREWVRDGGCLMADVMPATRHRLGRPRAASALQDVFGVDATGAVPHMELEPWYSVGTDAHPDFYSDPIWLPGDTTFLGLEATTAQVYGRMLSRLGNESQTFFINRYGDGQAILLNFVLCGLNINRSGWFRLFGDALQRKTGIRAPARLVDPDTGEPLPFRPLYAYRYGEAMLFGSIRGRNIWSGSRPMLVDDAAALGSADVIRVEWEGQRHVYDVRGHSYLGFGEQALIDLPSFEARLLATLPYRVASVDLNAPERLAAGTVCDIEATVRTTGGDAGRHVLYMDVVSPTGVRIPFYCRTLSAENGKARFAIPFADNDRPGAWRIAVRDVLSGVVAERGITLYPEN